MKKRRLPTEDEIAEMRELRARGLVIETIAAETGFSKSAVHRAVGDMPIDRRLNPAPRPPKRPTWLARAIKLRESGLTGLAIAARLKVPKSVVYRALDKFG